MRSSVLVLALVALASSAPVLGAEGGRVVEVDMLSGSFSPEVVRVEAGDLVVFRNTDGRGHTVTSAWDGGATFHAVLRSGEEFAVRFDAAGEYRVRCVPHSADDGHGGHEGMVTTVHVAGAAPATEGGASGGLSSAVFLVPLAAALLAFLGFAAFRLRGGAWRLPTRATRVPRS